MTAVKLLCGIRSMPLHGAVRPCPIGVLDHEYARFRAFDTVEVRVVKILRRRTEYFAHLQGQHVVFMHASIWLKVSNCPFTLASGPTAMVVLSCFAVP